MPDFRPDPLLQDPVTSVKEAQAWARHWLFAHALPLWWEQGADHASGGFHDALDATGKPVAAAKRLRVQARQVYVYARAGQLGWPGPWREAVRHGSRFMLQHYRRNDGLFRPTPDAVDEAIDLYDQAFVLLALAKLHEMERQDMPADVTLPSALETARTLMTALRQQLAHPQQGFEEARPRRLPLRANPHMHLLEAMLAWVEAGVHDEFAETAREIVALAVSRMIDPVSGALAECFDGDWSASCREGEQGREPGHHFEWAYLLQRADVWLGGNTRTVQQGLERFAMTSGVDAKRGVAVFALRPDGSLLDARARLWAQTERFRLALLRLNELRLSEQRLNEAAEHPSAEAAVLEAFATLRRFLDVPRPGLWQEWMEADGRFAVGPSPASSFYHLMSALGDLLSPPVLSRQA